MRRKQGDNKDRHRRYPEKCDYNKLNEKLTELDTLDRSLYTQKSLDALDAAIAEAKAIDPELLKDLYGDNQALIDGAIKKIDDAKAALLVMETFASQVVSDVYTSEVASGDSSTETVTLIKLLFEGKEKEFIVPEGITNIPKAGDIVIITVGGNEIISIEITAVELSEFTDGTTLSDITKHIAYEPVTPSVGDKAVFFKNSAGEVIFITKTTERIAETVYSASDSRLLIAGKEVSVAEGANFSAFTEKTLAKIIFAGRLAISAEPLTAIDATVSPSGENALYKENGGSEYKTLAASDTSFEAEEGSAHLTLTRLIEALKADGAAKTYNAKLFLDADGKLIACRLLDAVDESTGDAENPDSTGNTGGENPTT